MINQIRNTLHQFGIELLRYKPEYYPSYSLVKLLEHFDINTFIDVGANTGQTGLSLIDSGYNKKIISFEPIKEAYKALEANSKNYKNWKTLNCAIGDRDGKIIINISQNIQSSSILPMLKKLIDLEPNTKYVRKETCKIYKLDTIAPKYINSDDRLFLKLDTQGYEDKILKGSTKTLKKIKGIQLEMSLIPLYKGEKTYKEMLSKLDKIGFDLYQIYPGFTDPKTGRILQFDGVFFK